MIINPTENTDDTVRLRRPPPRVYTDVLGQTVWMGDIEALDLELEPERISDDPYNRTPIFRR